AADDRRGGGEHLLGAPVGAHVHHRIDPHVAERLRVGDAAGDGRDVDGGEPRGRGGRDAVQEQDDPAPTGGRVVGDGIEGVDRVVLGGAPLGQGERVGVVVGADGAADDAAVQEEALGGGGLEAHLAEGRGRGPDLPHAEVLLDVGGAVVELG